MSACRRQPDRLGARRRASADHAAPPVCLFRTEKAGDAAQQAALPPSRAEGGAALHAHALYEAYSHHWPHKAWPACLRLAPMGPGRPHPETPEMRAFAGSMPARSTSTCSCNGRRRASWASAQQAARDAGMPIGLIADLAVGADNGGSQAWSHQAEIAAGLTVGAPPDRLARKARTGGWARFRHWPCAAPATRATWRCCAPASPRAAACASTTYWA
jgi:4-alpha-glucanotransferase